MSDETFAAFGLVLSFSTFVCGILAVGSTPAATAIPLGAGVMIASVIMFYFCFQKLSGK
jgi:hypothetical protein